LETPDKPSLEQLADEAGVDYWTVRKWLAGEVARRRRERYRLHAYAIERLDARLAALGTAPTEQARKKD